MASSEKNAGHGLFSLSDLEFERFRDLIHRHTGIALTDQKRPLICSRLSRRLRHHGFVSFTDYYEYLLWHDEGGQELRKMLNAMTTNKTSFFRESHHFAFLGGQLMAELCERERKMGAPAQLRVWSAGCSTGEEAYSIAMTLLDGSAAQPARDMRILASDIDTDVLAVAERGVYAAHRMQGVSRHLVQRHFVAGHGRWQGHFRARARLRQMIAWRHINLLDPSWGIKTRFDCIFCRNVVIYFDKPAQRRLMERFCSHLRVGGYLILGHSESMLGMQVGLTYLGQTIYQKQRELDPSPGARG